MVKHLSLRRKI